MNKYLLSFLILVCISIESLAETVEPKINAFELEGKEANKLSVITRQDENINGEVTFSLNGIDKKLNFKNGEAAIPEQISSSTFLYLRPVESSFSGVKLYYILKAGENLLTINIPIVLLLIIPLFFFILGYFVRKLLLIVLGLTIAFFIFNKGLGISDYLQLVYQWFVSLF